MVIRVQTLFISFDGLTDPLGQSQILPYLIGISKEYAITILSCEKKERYQKESDSIEKLLQANDIKWEFIYFEEQSGFKSKFGYLQQLKQKAENIVKLKSIQLIHCRSYPATLIGLHFKKATNIPFIFDMRGFWADERLEGGIWKKNNWLHQLLYHYFKHKESQFFKESAHIVSLTENGKNYITREFNVKNDKITIIPCCVDLKSFVPQNQISSKAQLGYNPDDKLLVYVGSVGTWYLTKELIKCFKVWHDQDKHFKLLIITRDRLAVNDLLSDLTETYLKAIQTISASHNLIPGYLSMATASLFFIKNTFSKTASSPTKMAESWALNVPIITNSGIGDNDVFFRNNAGGILINELTDKSYLKAYQEFIALPLANYRLIAETNFDKDQAIVKYLNIYNQLLKLNEKKT